MGPGPQAPPAQGQPGTRALGGGWGCLHCYCGHCGMGPGLQGGLGVRAAPGGKWSALPRGTGHVWAGCGRQGGRPSWALGPRSPPSLLLAALPASPGLCVQPRGRRAGQEGKASLCAVLELSPLLPPLTPPVSRASPARLPVHLVQQASVLQGQASEARSVHSSSWKSHAEQPDLTPISVGATELGTAMQPTGVWQRHHQVLGLLPPAHPPGQQLGPLHQDG